MPNCKAMQLVRGHLFSVCVIAAAAVAAAGVFTFARPTYHPYVMPTPPHDLPYASATYTAADVSRAFAAVGIKLEAHGPRPTRSYPITDLSNKGLTVEATAFGDPQQVKDSGFSDYTAVDGHWAHFPRACIAGATNAERWRGNIRVMISCTRAGDASSAWLRRARRALGQL
jgi:hypothetical protein